MIARWTVRDLESLPQDDWLTHEIIDGELFISQPSHYKHQQVAGRIVIALNDWSKQSGLGEAVFSLNVALSDDNDVIPDVVWVSHERLATTENEWGHLTELPELVVEVLSSEAQSIRRDREVKLKLYSVTGAQEYWIADRFSKQIEVYRRENNRLVLMETLTNKDVLRSPLLPGFSGKVSQFFS